MSFVKYLDYLEGGIPQDEASQKSLKFIIDILLLMEECIKEERNIIFGRSQNLVFNLLSIYLLPACLPW